MEDQITIEGHRLRKASRVPTSDLRSGVRCYSLPVNEWGTLGRVFVGGTVLVRWDRDDYTPGAESLSALYVEPGAPIDELARRMVDVAAVAEFIYRDLAAPSACHRPLGRVAGAPGRRDRGGYAVR